MRHPNAPEPVKEIDLMRAAKTVKHHLSRARYYGCADDLTLEQWLDTLKYFENSCAYCGGGYQVLEHFISLDDGGGTTKSNCIPACKGCNSLKNSGGTRKESYYTNKRVVSYLRSHGAPERAFIDFHLKDKHTYLVECPGGGGYHEARYFPSKKKCLCLWHKWMPYTR